LIPAWLQAKRGSHIVITTIMFNFIAAALMVYLLVNVLRARWADGPGDGALPPGPTCPRCTTCWRT
jgi:general nucleoside transport system permease protein